VWQPSRAQWRVIWLTAAVLVLTWPPAEGRSLGMKATNWLADPRQNLPILPEPLPMGLGDDADAVAAHDLEETEYFRLRDSSAAMRVRLQLKVADEPFDRTTERQVLVGFGVLAALWVWRLGAGKP
jgi:hypothetical protein